MQTTSPAPCTAGSGVAAAQAGSGSTPSNVSLSIDAFPDGPGHLELPILDSECQPAFDKVERIAPELLEPPAAQDVQIFADSGCQSLQLVGPGDELRRDAALLRADLEQ